jgi:nicotinate-nucleotide adenylyltransferase
VVVARAALECSLDRVVFIPVRRPPHKDRSDILDPFHRFAMVALACTGEPALAVSAFEVARPGPSFTIDTVRYFVSAGHQVTLIMGTDSLAEIEGWRESRDLLDLADVIAYPRRPELGERLAGSLPAWIASRTVRTSEARDEAGRAGKRSVLCLDREPDDTSSTGIRDLLRSGRPVTGLLPPGTEEYIRKQGLYGESREGVND